MNPFVLLVICVAGWMNRNQQGVIEYLRFILLAEAVGLLLSLSCGFGSSPPMYERGVSLRIILLPKSPETSRWRFKQTLANHDLKTLQRVRAEQRPRSHSDHFGKKSRPLCVVILVIMATISY